MLTFILVIIVNHTFGTTSEHSSLCRNRNQWSPPGSGNHSTQWLRIFNTLFVWVTYFSKLVLQLVVQISLFLLLLLWPVFWCLPPWLTHTTVTFSLSPCFLWFAFFFFNANETQKGNRALVGIGRIPGKLWSCVLMLSHGGVGHALKTLQSCEGKWSPPPPCIKRRAGTLVNRRVETGGSDLNITGRDGKAPLHNITAALPNHKLPLGLRLSTRRAWLTKMTPWAAWKRRLCHRCRATRQSATRPVGWENAAVHEHHLRRHYMSCFSHAIKCP